LRRASSLGLAVAANIDEKMTNDVTGNANVFIIQNSRWLEFAKDYAEGRTTQAMTINVSSELYPYHALFTPLA
jgi:hypothetical protein